MSFAKKFSAGKTGEKLLISALQSYGFDAKLNEDYERRYDFDVYVDLPYFTLECKFDLMANVTHNIAIEHFNSYKQEPSGITRSIADFWVHIIYISKVPTLFLANRKKLLKSLDEIEPFKKIVAGGDKNSDMYIYKKHQMLSDDGSTPMQKMTKKVLLDCLGELNEE